MFYFLFYFKKKKCFSFKPLDLILMRKSMLMLRENCILLSIFNSYRLICGTIIQLFITLLYVCITQIKSCPPSMQH